MYQPQTETKLKLKVGYDFNEARSREVNTTHLKVMRDEYDIYMLLTHRYISCIPWTIRYFMWSSV